MIAYENRIGTIDISEGYLSKLIGHEVTSCFGVVGMVPSGNRQRLFSKLSKKELLDTGIIVSGNTDSLKVELHIVVTYGMNINAIAATYCTAATVVRKRKETTLLEWSKETGIGELE